jgi:2-hydroxy-3-oxopropionate reductase
MADIGFIGLGIMGTPMATNLQKGGHRLFLHSRSGVREKALLSYGAVELASPLEVTKSAEFVITMLPDTPDVERVLFGPQGVADGLQSGKVVIDMSSISPLQTMEFASRVQTLGAEYLDAPVSGGELAAKSGTLTIMVGGTEATFEHAKPVLELMGKTITLIGRNGAGQTAKVANQIVVALTIEAISEALVLASKAGADTAKVRQALLGGFASSKVLDVHGQRFLTRNFQPGFRIGLHQKDLRLALETGRRLEVPLPHTKSCAEMFEECAKKGLSSADHSALVQILEEQAGHELGKEAV